MNASDPIYLVSCVAKKLPAPAPARDLYVSTWFRSARAYVEATGCRWFILSALHGLVRPDQIVAPYEKTLLKMRAAEREHWARGVLDRLEPLIGVGSAVVMFAGARYREFLEPALRDRGILVHVPMKGLPIGKQLQWLARKRGKLNCLPHCST